MSLIIKRNEPVRHEIPQPAPRDPAQPRVITGQVRTVDKQYLAVTLWDCPEQISYECPAELINTMQHAMDNGLIVAATVSDEAILGVTIK